MKRHRWDFLFLLLLITITTNLPTAFCEDTSFHDDHLNDGTDVYANDYTPFIIPIDTGKQISVAPITTCTRLENDTWYPHFHPCKMAQTLLVDDDWSDGNANYTYMFEDWTDYDWNDIIVNLYASISYGISADMLLAFREAAWKNPFSLEITAEGTWIKIEWNSTDYPDMHSLIVEENETVEVDLFAESNPSDEAFFKFLVPPVSSFSWQPSQPFAGETVIFDASASHDLDKEVETYCWVFGDGASAETDNATITHSFVSPGTYHVNLTVIDNDGLEDTILKTIKVLATIGGETVSLKDTLITIWRNASTALIIAFIAASILVQRKRKQSTNSTE